MPLCYAPWANLDISPTGVISPCCKFQTKKYQQQFQIQQHSIEQYNTSDFVESLKQEMLKDQWPVGCERCKIEEKNNIPSKRQLDYQRWQEHYDKYNFDQPSFVTASIAFGNTCNLKCITCGPASSSRWQKEHHDIIGIDILSFKFYKKDFVETFLENTPNIVHIDIPGGEPFLSGIPEQKLLLQKYIEAGKANQISLHYTTNATQ
jgi:MoaA/NifB/PqqE/SkfB family radical SAM enzyme